jgi:leucyl-tRNA synthetase
MVFYDMGLVAEPEPFAALFPHGMVLKDGVFMSKSKGNTVVADDIITKYGCDTVRAYLMFAAPPAKDMDWSDSGIEGIARFLRRVERLVGGSREAARLHPYQADEQCEGANDLERELIRWTHRTIIRVTRDIEEEFQFNTAISALMEFANILVEARPDKSVSTQATSFAVKRLIVMLSPFAPHLAEEWWEQVGERPSLFGAAWPKQDAVAARADQVEVAVQINGRLRATVWLARGTEENDIKTKVLADERIAAFISGRPVRRWIIVADKLVNLVV